MQSSGAIAPRECGVVVSDVIARSAATKQSTLPLRGGMDCFVALLLAMTTLPTGCLKFQCGQSAGHTRAHLAAFAFSAPAVAAVVAAVVAAGAAVGAGAARAAALASARCRCPAIRPGATSNSWSRHVWHWRQTGRRSIARQRPSPPAPRDRSAPARPRCRRCRLATNSANARSAVRREKPPKRAAAR